MSTSEEVQVNFTVECDDFAVPEWPDLRCTATFLVHGYVEVDHSGDSVTPDGPCAPSVMLLDPTTYTISLVRNDLDVELPKWLQYRLATEDGDRLDAAFLAAIGGQDKLNDLATEQALDL